MTGITVVVMDLVEVVVDVEEVEDVVVEMVAEEGHVEDVVGEVVVILVATTWDLEETSHRIL